MFFQVNNSAPVIADLRAAVYGNVVSHGGRKDLETMLSVRCTFEIYCNVNPEKTLSEMKYNLKFRDILVDFAVWTFTQYWYNVSCNVFSINIFNFYPLK